MKNNSLFRLPLPRLLALTLIAGLSVAGCASEKSGAIEIPPQQTKGATLNIAPELLGNGTATNTTNRNNNNNNNATPDPTQPPQVTTAPAYFGPNAVGTGTTTGPSPNLPFVDSVSTCATILDPDARQLCLQSAGRR
jgi:hypothetical protein